MSTSQRTKTTSERTTPRPSDSLRKAGRAAFVWVVVFEAFHVYWAFGGQFGFGDVPAAEMMSLKVDSLGSLVFAIINCVPWVVGTIVPLALYQDWGRRVPAWMLTWCCWIGALILLVRGVSSWIDTALRGTGLMHNGLTGLTYKQELGLTHPSFYTLCSWSAIDTYFTLGGVLFLIAGIARRRSRRGTAVDPAAMNSVVSHDPA
ncbi:DUF3995 domain-containing protein [Streptomyces sp. NPDC051320]|uniref:DUF3995 domain-containing protein n=1 Tax=Streptomyces sp. NPDC051320 TaxID=3154644 RepID=UPI00342CDC5C